MGKCLIIRRGGGVTLAQYNSLLNAKTITDGLLANSNLILSAEHANDLDNGQSFGFDNVTAVQYKALHGTYSESVIVNPIATATSLILNTTVGLTAGQEYTLQDATNKEDVIITSIDSGTVVTVPAITNSYTSAYLYDYYVGSPVGVVDYDFRADVLANGTLAKSYNFNGSTSKAIGTGGSAFNAETIYLKLNITAQLVNEIALSFNNVDSKWMMLNVTAAGSLRLKTDNSVENDFAGAFTTGDNILILRHNGTKYDLFSNGTKIVATGQNTAVLNINKIALGQRENPGDNFASMDLFESTFTSTTITEQQALDITAGVVKSNTILTEANSEVFYDANQDASATIIENLGTDSAYDLTTTAVTIIDGGIVAPFTPMDLITQSYTLTNASGAILQHFAKFGTGSYNLMTETSTDHFAYEHSTEEDNIKIKTTVVGDTSQLLDIQLELGGISDV